MSPKTRAFALLAAFAAPACASPSTCPPAAASPSTVQPTPLDAADVVPPADVPNAIAELSWMVGCWSDQPTEGVADRDDKVMECWLPPIGNALFGVNQSFDGGMLVGFEHLRIVAEGPATTLTANPGGKGETPFRLTDHSSSHAIFENPDHDFPKRITYRLEGDSLRATVDDPAKPDGALTWQWKRRAQ